MVDDFALFDDWADKYAYIIEIGKKVDASARDASRRKSILCTGCQSRVWLVPEFRERQR